MTEPALDVPMPQHPLHPEQWAIPRTDAWAVRTAFGYPKLREHLMTLGFVPLHETTTLKHPSGWSRDTLPAHTKRPSQFGLWAHAAGVLLVAETARLNDPDAEPPVGKKAGKGPAVLEIKTLVQRDLGWAARGLDLAKGSAYQSHTDASGAWVSMEMTHLSTPSAGALHDWLEAVQSTGVLLPFERWSTRMHLEVPDELWVDLKPGQRLEAKALQAARVAKMAALPAHPAKAWMQAVAQQEAGSLPNFPFAAQRYLAQVAASQGEAGRYPDPAVRAQVARWMDWALSDPTQPVPEGPIALPQGQHLPGLLVWGWADTVKAHGHETPAHAAHWEVKWQQAIAHASEAAVRHWCTVPDAAGRTLPLVALEAVLDRTHRSDSALPGGPAQASNGAGMARLWDTLAQRLDPAQWVWTTPTSSPFGLYLEAALHAWRFGGERSEKPLHAWEHPGLVDYENLRAQWLAQGVDWEAGPQHAALDNDYGTPIAVTLADASDVDAIGRAWLTRRNQVPESIQRFIGALSQRALLRSVDQPAAPAPRRPRL